MDLIVSGCKGKMGSAVLEALRGSGHKLVSGVDAKADGTEGFPCVSGFSALHKTADCILDFSDHSQTMELLSFARIFQIPLVIGTTGQTEEEIAAIRCASTQLPILLCSNFARGLSLLRQMTALALAALPHSEVQITETHHVAKKDLPSGTAKALAAYIRTLAPYVPIIIRSERTGDEKGSHTVRVVHGAETVEIRHCVGDRSVYACEAIEAAAWLVARQPGLYTEKEDTADEDRDLWVRQSRQGR